MDCVFSPPEHANGNGQQGTCTTSTGASVSFGVNDEQAASGDGIRAFAGPRWDPFILDAPAALRTIATGELAFTDPSSIYLDGKNVLSLVVELDCPKHLGDVELVGVVAETLTRGKYTVRIERVGRPEVKNLMLAPKQFDQVNRDLEIRDLYNMEDAFHLGSSYGAAYRARLDANLAFWDGLDGNTDWPANGDGRHPLTDLVLADFLVVDVTKPYVEPRLLPRDRARGAARRGARDLRRASAERRRDGRAPHAADQRGARACHPRRRRPLVTAGLGHVPVPLAAEPGPAGTTGTPVTPGPSSVATAAVALELDDIQSGALHERPSPYVGTYILLRIDDRQAGRELVRRLLGAVDSGRPSHDPEREAWVTVAFTYNGLRGAGRATGLPRQLRARVQAGHGGPRGRDRRRRRERPGALGVAARDAGRPRRAGRALP